MRRNECIKTISGENTRLELQSKFSLEQQDQEFPYPYCFANDKGAEEIFSKLEILPPIFVEPSFERRNCGVK